MRYRRAYLPGGSFFFTVVTKKRHPLFLSSAAAVLRMAFRALQTARPFAVEAIVVLPDHLHCIWTLPPGDADFATRWRLVKTWFTKHCDPALRVAPNQARTTKREQAVWQHRYWEHLLREESISSDMWNTFITIRSNTDWCYPRYNGRTLVFVGMQKRGCIPGIGGPARWISREWDMNERKTELSDDVVHRRMWSVGLRSANPTNVTEEVRRCVGWVRPSSAVPRRPPLPRHGVWESEKFFWLPIKNEHVHPICRVVVSVMKIDGNAHIRR